MRRDRTKVLGRIALFTALITLSAWIVVPSPIPFTMQTFSVLLAAAVLGGNKAFAAVSIYILLGVLGLPVFSGGKGGIGVLFGATGGYIIGFLPCAYIVGKLTEKTKKRPFAIALKMALGLLCDYVIGVLWYAFIYLEGQGIWTAAMVGILPFIVPDALKIVLASVAFVRLQKIL